MDQFPPNSRKAQAEPKRVERVTSGETVRRRKSLGKQFRHTFIGGDAKTAWQYVVLNVIIPTAREMMAEAGATVIEKIVYGDHRPRRGGPPGGSMGHISYNRMSQGPPRDRPGMGQMLPRTARARQSFDEIIIPSRQEAEEVLDRLFDLISKYDTATVADLYELTGLTSSHIDNKWGWEDLRGASVGRLRGGGYLLNLPEPKSLE
jgi:hypothetical protein